MLTRRRFLVLTGSAGVTVAAVAAGLSVLPEEGGTEDGFPLVRYGEESCLHCGMIIDDPRFAAAWTEPGGVERHFDDIGCAVTDAVESPLADGALCFVHDYVTEEWLDAPAATYVVSPAIHSPMAFGVVALHAAEDAHALAAEHHGQVVGWHELPHHLEGGHS